MAEEKDDEDDSDDSVFEVMGGQKEGSWAVSEKVMKLFNKLADIELEKPELNELKKSFLPSEEEAHHFQPPKLPLSMWQNISSSSNHADAYALYRLNKVHTQSTRRPLSGPLPSSLHWIHVINP